MVGLKSFQQTVNWRTYPQSPCCILHEWCFPWCSEPSIIQKHHWMLCYASPYVWIRVLGLNSSLLSKLESFQSELRKRILKLSKYTSNNIPLLALRWPSMCTRLLCNKLSFLHHICNGQLSAPKCSDPWLPLTAPQSLLSDRASSWTIPWARSSQKKSSQTIKSQLKVWKSGFSKQIASELWGNAMDHPSQCQVPSAWSRKQWLMDEVLGYCSWTWCRWKSCITFHSQAYVPHSFYWHKVSNGVMFIHCPTRLSTLHVTTFSPVTLTYSQSRLPLIWLQWLDKSSSLHWTLTTF